MVYQFVIQDILLFWTLNVFRYFKKIKTRRRLAEPHYIDATTSTTFYNSYTTTVISNILYSLLEREIATINYRVILDIEQLPCCSYPLHMGYDHVEITLVIFLLGLHILHDQANRYSTARRLSSSNHTSGCLALPHEYRANFLIYRFICYWSIALFIQNGA